MAIVKAGFGTMVPFAAAQAVQTGPSCLDSPTGATVTLKAPLSGVIVTPAGRREAAEIAVDFTGSLHVSCQCGIAVGMSHAAASTSAPTAARLANRYSMTAGVTVGTGGAGLVDRRCS